MYPSDSITEGDHESSVCCQHSSVCFEHSSVCCQYSYWWDVPPHAVRAHPATFPAPCVPSPILERVKQQSWPPSLLSPRRVHWAVNVCCASSPSSSRPAFPSLGVDGTVSRSVGAQYTTLPASPTSLLAPLVG
jgi:hypothetical protein